MEGIHDILTPSSKVNPTDFELLKLLGSGAFGKVFLSRKLTGVDAGQIYAIKVVKKDKIIAKTKGVEHTLTERKVLETVRECAFLATLHYAYQTDKRLHLVMDFIRGGDVFTHLIKKGRFTPDETKFIMSELTLALETLHSLSIIYRDIKLENILLDADGHVVLTDFGLSRQFQLTDENHEAYSYCGTVEYMSPEVIKKEAYTMTADWWSLGVLWYEVLTGTSPFTLAGGDNTQRGVSERIKIGKYPRISTPGVPPLAIQLIASLITVNPRQRLGFEGSSQVKDHPYLKDTDWAKLRDRGLKPIFVPTPLAGPDDTVNFASDFTNQGCLQSPASTPAGAEPSALFSGFSYVAPSILMQRAKKLTNIGEAIRKLRLLQAHQKDHDFFVSYAVDLSQEPIGRGNFSVVFPCEKRGKRSHSSPPQGLIVKILFRCILVDREIETLQRCQGHPNVVKLFAVFHDKLFSYLILERLPGGELFKRISAKARFTECEARHVFVQLVACVAYLHSCGVVHRDIKSENILFIDEETESPYDNVAGDVLTSGYLHSPDRSVVKLIDFGFARFTTIGNGGGGLITPCYTLSHAAPELVSGQLYSKAVDYWSLGVVLYTMLSGQVPFCSSSDVASAAARDQENKQHQDSLTRMASTDSNRPTKSAKRTGKSSLPAPLSAPMVKPTDSKSQERSSFSTPHPPVSTSNIKSTTKRPNIASPCTESDCPAPTSKPSKPMSLLLPNTNTATVVNEIFTTPSPRSELPSTITDTYPSTSSVASNDSSSGYKSCVGFAVPTTTTSDSNEETNANSSRDNIVGRICSGNFDLSGPNWDLVSDCGKDLVRGLLTVDPNQRISLSQIVGHPWLTNFYTWESAQAVGTTIYPRFVPLSDSSAQSQSRGLNNVGGDASALYCLQTPTLLGSTSSFLNPLIDATYSAFRKAARENFDLQEPQISTPQSPDTEVEELQLKTSEPGAVHHASLAKRRRRNIEKPTSLPLKSQSGSNISLKNLISITPESPSFESTTDRRSKHSSVLDDSSGQSSQNLLTESSTTRHSHRSSVSSPLDSFCVGGSPPACNTRSASRKSSTLSQKM